MYHKQWRITKNEGIEDFELLCALFFLFFYFFVYKRIYLPVDVPHERLEVMGA